MKMAFYLDPTADGRNLEKVGDLDQTGAFTCKEPFKENLEKIIKQYDLTKDADFRELRQRLSGTLMKAIIYRENPDIS